MTTIHKYPFQVDDSIEIEMPVGATILHLDVQNNVPCIWAQVDSEAASAPRPFRIVGTGHAIDFATDGYVGSFMLMGGMLVYHLYEVGGQG